MKIFKYKFTKLTKILMGVCIGLCFVGIGTNIILIVTGDIKSAANPVYPIIQYALMFLIPIALLVIMIGLLVSSYYAIDENYFKTSFGIIKSKYKISDIETLILDRTTNKLTLYMKNNSFMVIVVKEEWYNDFIDSLCKANRNIEFSIQSKESTGKDGKDDDNKE